MAFDLLFFLIYYFNILIVFLNLIFVNKSPANKAGLEN